MPRRYVNDGAVRLRHCDSWWWGASSSETCWLCGSTAANVEAREVLDTVTGARSRYDIMTRST